MGECVDYIVDDRLGQEGEDGGDANDTSHDHDLKEVWDTRV